MWRWAPSPGNQTAITVEQAAANLLVLGDLIGDSIMVPGESDQFLFTAQAGDVVLFALVKTSGGWITNIERPEATIFSPTAVQVATIQPGYVQDTMPESGTYTIRVVATNLVSGLDGTGSYNLGLEGLDPLSPGAVSIAAGEVLSGSIDVPGDVDFFTFTGLANDVVFLTLLKTGGT